MGKICDICGEDSGDGRLIHELTECEKDLLQIKVEQWEKYRRVCEKHYMASDIGGGVARKRLKTGALPTLFDIEVFDHAYAVKTETIDSPSLSGTETLDGELLEVSVSKIIRFYGHFLYI